MNSWKTSTVKILSAISVLSVSGLISIVSLQTTVLNREVMKGWLRDSGVYSHLVADISKVSPQQEPVDGIISTTLVQQALVKTFPAGYVQQQSERMIDGVYGWLEGKTPQPEFSLPLDDKRTTFITELATVIQPQMAELPLCNEVLVVSNRLCRPPDMPIDEYSQRIATEAAVQEKILAEPITQETLATEQSSADMQTLNHLPAVVEWFSWLTIALPTILAACVGAIVLVAHDRLWAFKYLSRRIFIGTTLALLSAGVLWYLSANANSLPILNAMQSGVVELLTPVFQKVIGGIAQQLALLSGAAAATSGIAWLILLTIQRRRTLPHQLSTPTVPPPYLSIKK